MASRRLVEKFPDVLEDIVEEYDSGYYYLRSSYDNTHRELKSKFGGDIAKEYRKRGNVVFALLNSPRVVKIFADCIENGDREMLAILKENYITSSSPPSFIPLHIVIGSLVPLELNDLSIVNEIRFLPGYTSYINLSKEMVRALYKKFKDDAYMLQYILQVRDMDLYREAVKGYDFKSRYGILETPLGDIEYVHPEDLETFLKIIKDKITTKQINKAFLTQKIPSECVFPIIDFFKINISAFRGEPDVIEELIDRKILRKGSYILPTKLPSSRLIQKLKSIDVIVSLFDPEVYDDDSEYEQVIEDLGSNYSPFNERYPIMTHILR